MKKTHLKCGEQKLIDEESYSFLHPDKCLQHARGHSLRADVLRLPQGDQRGHLLSLFALFGRASIGVRGEAVAAFGWGKRDHFCGGSVFIFIPSLGLDDIRSLSSFLSHFGRLQISVL